MPQELLRHNPEANVVLEEMHLTMGRMRVDVGRPRLANTTARNHFHENLMKVEDSMNSSPVERFRGSNTYLLSPGYYLYALKMPEMIAYFRKRDKHSPFPQEPQAFFSQLQNPPGWVQRQLGFSRDEVTLAENIFGNLTTALDGQTPLLWRFAELTEIIRSGFGIVDDPDKHRKIGMEIYRKSSNQAIPFHVFLACVDSAFLHDMLKFYIHPGTFEMLNNLMKEEDGILLGPGEGMRHPAITKIHEEIETFGLMTLATRVRETDSQS